MSVGDDKNDLYWKLLKHQVQEKRIEKVFRTFAESGIETLLVKGWAAARNYPEPFERWSVDIDAAVRPDNFERGEQLLKEQDIRGVDLHKGLRHLDAVGWDDLYANAETVGIGAAKVRIPRAEDHLRILCVHWLNDGGADKERLRDIFYAVKNRPDDFDWRRCLDAAGARRRRWVVCTIGLAEKYLALDLSGTPLEHEAKNLPGWLVKTVEREWKRGIRLKPLDTCFADRRELYEQIKIRMPPNPIQATVEMNGDFDGKTRLHYQIGTLFIRLKPSIAKIKRSLRTGEWKNKRADTNKNAV